MAEFCNLGVEMGSGLFWGGGRGLKNFVAGGPHRDNED